MRKQLSRPAYMVFRVNLPFRATLEGLVTYSSDGGAMRALHIDIRVGN